MSVTDVESLLRIAVPKGRMYEGVVTLLQEAGLQLTATARSYRPLLSLPGCEVKILKPQNIVEMLHAGSRDVGFTGGDWVAELDGKLAELLDTGLDPVRVVAAAPRELLQEGRLPARELLVASEYDHLTREWVRERGLQARFVRSYGATEVFPPEDADVIVDNTATGSTLDASGLEVVDEIMRSSSRVYASPQAMAVAEKRRRIEDLVMLLASVLEARRRVMVEVNVGAGELERLLEVLPCMREPTVAPLAGGGGYAVKAAVLREELPGVIPLIKVRGGTDIVVTRLGQIVP
jgi:ATP phosphoribosyltransferase